jgi:hypothetical protein
VGINMEVIYACKLVFAGRNFGEWSWVNSFRVQDII